MPDGRGSRFVFAGLSLVALSVVIPLLQVALVVPKSIQVATCYDTPYSINPSVDCVNGRIGKYIVAGTDAEPAILDATYASLVAQRVGHRLETISELDPLPYIWDESPRDRPIYTSTPNTLREYYQSSEDAVHYFVSALPHGTNTGVLREHALRMNSSTAQCQRVPAAEFPEACPGERPFTGEFSGALRTIRFCAPGAYETAPWTLSRNRQDITEEVYFDIVVPKNDSIDETLPYNRTVRCEVNSTRGYFELPNYYNDGIPGQLLDKWPSPQEMEKNFNDYLSYNIKPSER